MVLYFVYKRSDKVRNNKYAVFLKIQRNICFLTYHTGLTFHLEKHFQVDIVWIKTNFWNFEKRKISTRNYWYWIVPYTCKYYKDKRQIKDKKKTTSTSTIMTTAQKTTTTSWVWTEYWIDWHMNGAAYPRSPCLFRVKSCAVCVTIYYCKVSLTKMTIQPVSAISGQIVMYN